MNTLFENDRKESLFIEIFYENYMSYILWLIVFLRDVIRCSDEIYREVFKDNYFGLLEVDCIPLTLSLNSQAYINDYWSETIITW